VRHESPLAGLADFSTGAALPEAPALLQRRDLDLLLRRRGRELVAARG